MIRHCEVSNVRVLTVRLCTERFSEVCEVNKVTNATVIPEGTFLRISELNGQPLMRRTCSSTHVLHSCTAPTSLNYWVIFEYYKIH